MGPALWDPDPRVFSRCGACALGRAVERALGRALVAALGATQGPALGYLWGLLCGLLWDVSGKTCTEPSWLLIS